MPRRYVPKRGDLVWLQFTPQAGREQAGHRPALVLSPKEYNEKAGLALVCPVTSRVKGYSFEVLLPKGLKASGAVLADHVKSLDWHARNAKRIDTVPQAVLDEVLAKIEPLLGSSA